MDNFPDNMKRLSTTLLMIFSFCLSSVSYSQNIPSDSLIAFDIQPMKLNMVKTNPLALIWSQIPFTSEARFMYERVGGLHESTMVGLSYVFPSPYFKLFWDSLETDLGYQISTLGYRVQAGQKFYLLNKQRAPNGFFIMPHASYNNLRITLKDLKGYYAHFIFFNVSLLAGYQLVLFDLLTIEAYTGAGWRDNYVLYGDPNTVKVDLDEIVRGFKFTFAMQCGITF